MSDDIFVKLRDIEIPDFVLGKTIKSFTWDVSGLFIGPREEKIMFEYNDGTLFVVHKDAQGGIIMSEIIQKPKEPIKDVEKLVKERIDEIIQKQRCEDKRLEPSPFAITADICKVYKDETRGLFQVQTCTRLAPLLYENYVGHIKLPYQSTVTLTLAKEDVGTVMKTFTVTIDFCPFCGMPLK